GVAQEVTRFGASADSALAAKRRKGRDHAPDCRRPVAPPRSGHVRMDRFPEKPLRRRSSRRYNSSMKSANTAPVLDRLVGPLGECLTPESARRLLALKADRKLQARVDYLAGRCNEGLLTPEERAEYGNYVSYGT